MNILQCYFSAMIFISSFTLNSACKKSWQNYQEPWKYEVQKTLAQEDNYQELNDWYAVKSKKFLWPPENLIEAAYKNPRALRVLARKIYSGALDSFYFRQININKMFNLGPDTNWQNFNDEEIFMVLLLYPKHDQNSIIYKSLLRYVQSESRAFYAPASLSLALYMQQNRPNCREWQKIIALLKSAANQGLAAAHYYLAKIYAGPDRNLRTYSLAHMHCSIAAKKGWPAAQYMLAKYFTSKEEALKWHFCAKKQRFPAAINAVGAYYYSGEELEQNLSKAFKYFQRAAVLGSAKAQLNLAHLYAQGIFVEQNLIYARTLYNQAASAGY